MRQIKTRIAGFNHHEGSPAVLSEMRVGTELALVPEPNNPHDRDAIAVWRVPLGSPRALRLGYIPRVDLPLVRERLGDETVDVRCYKDGTTFNSIVLKIQYRDPLS